MYMKMTISSLSSDALLLSYMLHRVHIHNRLDRSCVWERNTEINRIYHFCVTFGRPVLAFFRWSRSLSPAPSLSLSESISLSVSLRSPQQSMDRRETAKKKACASDGERKARKSNAKTKESQAKLAVLRTETEHFFLLLFSCTIIIWFRSS